MFQPVYDWSVVVPQVLERIREGESLNAFAGKDGLPSKGTIAGQCLKPEWVEQYRQAQEVRAELDGLDLDQTIANIGNGKYTPQQGKAMGDLIVKRMAQRAPKRYNERIQTINHKHTVETSIGDRLRRGEERLRPDPIEVEAIEAIPVVDEADS
jgi:hypothetical protein